jgi:hypothetical protein
MGLGAGLVGRALPVGQVAAEVMQEDLQAALFRGLGKVVGGPILLAGRPNRDNVRVDGRCLTPVIAFAGQPDRVDVLAGLLPKLEVVAGADVTIDVKPRLGDDGARAGS